MCWHITGVTADNIFIYLLVGLPVGRRVGAVVGVLVGMRVGLSVMQTSSPVSKPHVIGHVSLPHLEQRICHVSLPHLESHNVQVRDLPRIRKPSSRSLHKTGGSNSVVGEEEGVFSGTQNLHVTGQCCSP
jgi:hypothetical protein